MLTKELKKNKGITLVILIIMIIILLILAEITINAITGDNGIIGNAGQAKEETEIANEREIVEKATVQAMGNNKYGNIEEDELQGELDKETGEGKTDATDIGEEFEVVFIDSKRYYIVDKDGNVGEAQEIIKDKNPGDITTGKDGEELDGSEENPYEIWCIEDLVALSNMVNGSGIKLENENPIEVESINSFSEKYIELKTNLNFKSKLSYQNSERTDFGDINGNLNDGNTLMNEMTTGIGFKPIGNEERGFFGVFDGNEKEIQNIYIKTDKIAGLFSEILVDTATIKDLGITGVITSTDSYVGGIVGSYTSGTITNCYNKCEINGSSYAGGIIGHAYATNVELSNCYNFGNVTGKIAAGILSRNGGDGFRTIITNCFNVGNITGTEKSTAGGILGDIKTMTLNINNCYNLGEIKSDTFSGGIVGYSRYTVNINNGYNAGRIYSDGKADIIVPEIWNSKIVLKNFFYDESNLIKGVQIYSKDAISFKNNKEGVEELKNNLNEYMDESGIYPNRWYKWKLGEDGYPILDFDT